MHSPRHYLAGSMGAWHNWLLLSASSLFDNAIQVAYPCSNTNDHVAGTASRQARSTLESSTTWLGIMTLAELARSV